LQASLVKALLVDIESICKSYPVEVILTLNVPEVLGVTSTAYTFPLIVQQNIVPKGFAANHNQAFSLARGQFFCVMNPDIRLESDPFPVLLACLHTKSIGVVAPVVINEDGGIEDSARCFPTPLKIICKALGGCRRNDYVMDNKSTSPDWVAGMFMLFPKDVFAKLDGFDQRYFLYYEDVDLCVRLRLKGYEVAICRNAKAIHNARRSSHYDSRYFKWHITSMLRFFLSPSYLKIRWLRLTSS